MSRVRPPPCTVDPPPDDDPERRSFGEVGDLFGIFRSPYGGVAQLVERFGRIEEARGSIPLTSTSSLAGDVTASRRLSVARALVEG